MALMNTKSSWGLPARALHWLIGIIILSMLALGFYTAEIVTDVYAQYELVQIHKSWGFLVFFLVLARLIWRLVNPTPALPDHMPAHERLLSHAGHSALYVLMIVMPLSGWLMASASELQEMYGIKNMVFGLFEMPDPVVPGDKALEELFGSIHFWSGIAMVVILAGHVGAALKHHFINRDTILRRMIKGN